MLELSYHPNGFLQVAGGTNKRLHVWSSDIPRQQRPTLIHNHRFGFKSTVIMGMLINVRYRVLTPGSDEWSSTFVRFVPKTHEGRYTELVQSMDKAMYTVVVEDYQVLHEGESYEMRPYEYHESHPWGFAVTLMEKGENYPHEPSVLVPFGVKPDNKFTRNVKFIEEFLEAK